jgi:hypothetical protein
MDPPHFSSWEAIDEYLGEARDYKTLIQDLSGTIVRTVETHERIHWPCKACQKTFATKQCLERHHDRFPLCKNWKQEDGPPLSEPVTQWAGNLIAEALKGETHKTCKFCQTEFSTVGNLNKHFASSVPCNRFAYSAVKKAFADA